MPFEVDAAVGLHAHRFDDHILHAVGQPPGLKRREQFRRDPHGARAVFVAMTGVSSRQRAEASEHEPLKRSDA
jgi:hypothetical protein